MMRPGKRRNEIDPRLPPFIVGPSPGSSLLTSHRLMRFAPLLAAVVFGSWAAFVNSEYGIFVLIRSGLGQGTYALFSTWIVSKVAADVYACHGGAVKRFGLSFVASFLTMIAIPLTIHYLIRTPEIVNAILPGVLWGTVYISVYIWTLSKHATQRVENNCDQPL